MKTVLFGLLTLIISMPVVSDGLSTIKANQTKTYALTSETTNEIIVRYKDVAENINASQGTGNKMQLSERIAKADRLNRRLGMRLIKRFKHFKSLDIVEKPANISLRTAIETFKQDPDVLYAEPNYQVHHHLLPDDHDFDELWALHNVGPTLSRPLAKQDVDINAPEAWDITTGDQNIVVAVIDSGVDYTHPDLVDNMWVNPGEIPGNNIDDDGNGYVDDIHGIDAVRNTGTPTTTGNHGTHVAGTIGAAGSNGQGVTGVNWNISMISCYFIRGSAGGSTADAIQCLDYILDLKTRAVNPVNIVATNNSWGGSEKSQALEEAIKRHQDADILFVSSAGNSRQNIDISPTYPASYDLPNIISVGAFNMQDKVSGFSNVGRHSVDVFAPGSDIRSTFVGDSYGSYSGTSMAAPHVTGLVALLKAQEISRTGLEIRNLIISSGYANSTYQDVSVSGKRVRAVDINDSGAMNCDNQVLSRRTRPSQNRLVLDATQLIHTVPLNYIQINCEQPLTGNIDFNVQPAGITQTLRDDGENNDQLAGDGMFSAQVQITEPSIIEFPNNESMSVEFGYAYSLPDVIPYSYYEITTPDISATNVVEHNPPFPIPFGDSKPGFSRFWSGANGIISFDGPNLDVSPLLIPVTAERDLQSFIAAHWDDLDFELGGTQHVQVFGEAPNRRYVVEWRNVVHRLVNQAVTFQVVLFEEKSDVQINYKDVLLGGVFLGNGGFASIGIQSAPSIATMYSFNWEEAIHNQTSYLWKTQNDRPIVSAGQPNFAAAGEQVVLNGSNSRSEFGDIVEYQWTQYAGPAVSLSNANGAQPSFNVPVTAEPLTFMLTITDSAGNTGSDITTIYTNVPPNAGVLFAQNVEIGDLVYLDSSASTDEDGEIVSYQWRQRFSDLPADLGIPPTGKTPVTLSNADQATASFIFPEGEAFLVFDLVVVDDDGASGIEIAVVYANDKKPFLSFLKPNDRLVMNTGDELSMVSKAFDSEDGDLSESIRWQFLSEQNSYYEGERITMRNRPVGEDIFELSIVDSVKNKSTVQIPVSINEPGNHAPSIILANRYWGRDWLGNESITSSAIVSDKEDGLQSLTVEWYIDNKIVESNSLTLDHSLNGYSAGNHTVEAVVHDSDGRYSSEKFTFNYIQNKYLFDFESTPLDASTWQVEDEGTQNGPSEWVIENGFLVQKSNIYTYPSSSDISRPGTSIFHTKSLPLTNYKLAILLRSEDDDAIGAWFRKTTNGGYRFSMDSQRGVRRLVKQEAGQYTLIHQDNVAYNPGQTYLIEIAVQDDFIEILVDGQQFFSGRDSSLSQGTFGLYTWANTGSYFDLLVIEDLTEANNSPVINIVIPTNGGVFQSNEPFLLAAEAKDPEDGDLSAFIEWFSDLQGPLGQGRAIGVNNLIDGTHLLTARISDSFGESISQSISVSIGSPSSQPGQLYQNNFDTNDLLDWTVVDEGSRSGPSQWHINNGELIESSNIYSYSFGSENAGSYLKYNHGYQWSDYRVEVELRSSDDDGIGIMFGIQDDDNYYRFSMDGQRRERKLVKKSDGRYSVIFESIAGYVTNADYQLSIDSADGKISINLNGEKIYEGTDSNPLSGSIGFYNWANQSSYFDNLKILDISNTP